MKDLYHMNNGDKKYDLHMPDKSADLRNLYNNYADKLLGRITAIVNHRELAEDCIVKIFEGISLSKNDSELYGNTWSWLTTLATKEISHLGAAADGCKSVVNNTSYIQSHKYLSRMNDIQRQVFCGVYYHKTRVAQLATELNIPDQMIRQQIKEAFRIIREVKDEN
jgi:DNA-directed RNA polymerase specialized sigma24 family protein